MCTNPAPPSRAAATRRRPFLLPMPSFARKLREPCKSTFETYEKPPTMGTPPSIALTSASRPSQYFLPAALSTGGSARSAASASAILSAYQQLKDSEIKGELQKRLNHQHTSRTETRYSLPQESTNLR